MVLLVFMLLRMLLSDNEMNAMIKELNASSLYVSEWVSVKNADGIELQERWVKVNDSLTVRERKGIMVINGSVDEVVEFLSNPKTIKLWMKNVQEVRLFMKGDAQLTYIVIHLPWPFSDRDLVANYSVHKTDNNHCTIRMKSEDGTHVGSSKIVRINSYNASWNLEQVANNKVHIEFQVFSAEPPLFPQWVQEPVLKKVFHQNLLRLKAQLNAHRN